MGIEFFTVSDGTYTLVETENRNQFYFYRNDKEVLTEVYNEPLDLYQAYVMRKMMCGEITSMVMKNICSQISDDGKCLRLTVSEAGEDVIKSNNLTDNPRKPNFLNRLIHKFRR